MLIFSKPIVFDITLKSFLRGNAINSLQDSIGSVSSNLLLAYQKMEQNLQNTMQMMSNMNKMMESFVLLNIEASIGAYVNYLVVPSFRRIEDSSYVMDICIKNNINVSLKGVVIEVHSSVKLQDWCDIDRK